MLGEQYRVIVRGMDYGTNNMSEVLGCMVFDIW